MVKIKSKPKVKKQPEKHVVFVLDETGSMSICRQATISGFNEFIQKLQADYGKQLKFTLTKFNLNKIEIAYTDALITTVKPLNEKTYCPNDLTPLYDVVGQTIKHTENFLKAGRIIFVIMTDGEENSSKEFTRKGIFDLITKKRTEGWEFVFLGANQDSWVTGQGIGIHVTADFSTRNMKEAYGTAYSACVSYLDSGSVMLKKKKIV